jgi:outer membrane biogenesis lipoprotein LolB
MYIKILTLALLLATVSANADEHSAVVQEFMSDVHQQDQARIQRYHADMETNMQLNQQLFNARFNAWAAQQHNSTTLQFGGGLPPKVIIYRPQ